MPGRFPQLNSLGVRQACGDWPSNPQEATATCPEGSIGTPVTVALPAGAFYADTIENADELALEDAQEQAEAALECTGVYSCLTGLPSPMEPAVAPLIIDLRADTFGLLEDITLIRGVLAEDGNKIGLAVDQDQSAPALLVSNRAIYELNAGVFELAYIITSAPGVYYFSAINRLYDLAGYENLGEGAIGARAWFTADQLTPPSGRPVTNYAETQSWNSIGDDGTPSFAKHFDRCTLRRVLAGVIEQKILGVWTPVEFILPPEWDSITFGAISGNGRKWFGYGLQGANAYLVVVNDGTIIETVLLTGSVEPSEPIGCASDGSACYGAQWIWRESDGLKTITETLADASLSYNPVWTSLFFEHGCHMSATGEQLLISAAGAGEIYNVFYVKLPVAV